MATQVVEVHESPVTVAAPVGKVDSLVHMVAPDGGDGPGDDGGVEGAGEVARGGGLAVAGRRAEMVPIEVTAGEGVGGSGGDRRGWSPGRRGRRRVGATPGVPASWMYVSSQVVERRAGDRVHRGEGDPTPGSRPPRCRRRSPTEPASRAGPVAVVPRA